MWHPQTSSTLTERGSGPPLLLVHGLMVPGEMFEPVIEHFGTRHRVIVPDLRGHGRSRGLAPPYTAAQLASDLSRLLEVQRMRKSTLKTSTPNGVIMSDWSWVSLWPNQRSTL